MDNLTGPKNSRNFEQKFQKSSKSIEKRILGTAQAFLNLTPWLVKTKTEPIYETKLISVNSILRHDKSHIWMICDNFWLIYLRNFQISRREIDTLTRYDHLGPLWHEKWLILKTYLVLCIDLFTYRFTLLCNILYLRYFQGLLLRMSESWLILE